MSFIIRATDIEPAFNSLGLAAPGTHGEKIVLLACRAAVPVSSTEIDDSVELDGSRDFDLVHNRCTHMQFWPETGKIAAYPGSTTPNLHYARQSVNDPGPDHRCNMPFSGCYRFKRGIHKEGRPGAHPAFLEDASLLIGRATSTEPFNWPENPSVEFPGDDIHCGFTNNSTDGQFSSEGCQTIEGVNPNSEPWNTYRNRAYAAEVGSGVYRYLLLTADRWKELLGDAAFRGVLVGSTGSLATAVQEALFRKGFSLGESGVDGLFGPDSGLALVKFQRSVSIVVDGLCGPETLKKLGLEV